MTAFTATSATPERWASVFQLGASVSAKARPTAQSPADFILFGPTCDSADRMKGPFRLPADMREGDWIELGQLGAYGACLGSRFNGFGPAPLVEVADPPMLPTPGY